jgi:hypothetical protein
MGTSTLAYRHKMSSLATAESTLHCIEASGSLRRAAWALNREGRDRGLPLAAPASTVARHRRTQVPAGK